jgi:glycosyltransferase involved in cell wall biosynthesis
MISCYIPCYNHGKYLRAVIESIRAQTHPVDELFVVDDASSDDSIRVAEAAGVRVVAMQRNQGRGSVRARAMNEARHEFVLSCDATNALGPDFIERALPYMQDTTVVGVCALMVSQHRDGVCARWRDRQLFRVGELTSSGLNRDASLATSAALVRKSPVLEVGNYDARLRSYEDEHLGRRLRRVGYRIVFDPAIRVQSIRRDNLLQLWERYARWHSGYGGPMKWADYKNAIYHSFDVLARRDIQAGDLPAAIISLVCPHYQYLRSLLQKRPDLNPEDLELIRK